MYVLDNYKIECNKDKIIITGKENISLTKYQEFKILTFIIAQLEYNKFNGKDL